MLVDSHCHLDYEGLIEDVDAVVARAEAAGVRTLLTICTRPTALDGVLAIAERFPNVWCAAGVHPHHVAEQGVQSIERLLEIARHPKVVGIGETGLDYHYDYSPRPQQQESFRNHIRAARAAGLPFIVHTREAEADTASILREELADGPVPGVMHCFSSSRQLADTALELGLHVSFAGIVTFRNADDLREIARRVPDDRLLVETDAPFLAPVPKRGKRNEPAFVSHTAIKLAEIRGCNSETLAAQTTGNFFELFKKCRPPE